VSRVEPRVAALLCVPPLLWAGNAVVGRLVVGHFPPQLLNALRWSVALALLLPLGWRALSTPAARAAIRQRWRYLASLGLFGVSLYNALQYLALTTTTAVNATLIAASGPIWMMLTGTLLYAERPRWAQWAGSALSLAGVALVIGRGDPLALARVQFVAGDLLMIVATAVWAIYSWQLARPPPSMRAPQRPDWNWAEFLVVQMAFGLGWSWLWAALAHAVAPQPIVWSGGTVLALLYVAVGPSIAAFWCWGAGVARAGPTTAAFFANLTPPFAALLSSLLVNEPPRPYHAVAFALVVAGIIVSSRR
jgi:drug/metabolite transporter (DMT)-like permease